jgi:hypothetical protein
MLPDEEVTLAIKQDAIQVSWETGTGHPFRSGQGEEAPIFVGNFQSGYGSAALGIAPDWKIAHMPLDRDSRLALLQWRQSETLTNSGIDFLTRHRSSPSSPLSIMQVAFSGKNDMECLFIQYFGHFLSERG